MSVCEIYIVWVRCTCRHSISMTCTGSSPRSYAILGMIQGNPACVCLSCLNYRTTSFLLIVPVRSRTKVRGLGLAYGVTPITEVSLGYKYNGFDNLRTGNPAAGAEDKDWMTDELPQWGSSPRIVWESEQARIYHGEGSFHAHSVIALRNVSRNCILRSS